MLPTSLPDLPTPSHSAIKTLRLGAVSYLNTKPLIWQLERYVPQARTTLDLPSRLADQLAAGNLDVALVPIVEHFRQAGSRIVSSACIACEGPVWSVKVYFRVPPGQVRTLALDEGSRTSAALCRVLLARGAGVRPTLLPLPIGDTPASSPADAILVIGDRAMQTPAQPFVETWDLGEQWHAWTGLPFVFAAWIARDDYGDDGSLGRQLDAIRDHGIARIDEIACHEAARVGLTVAEARHYLAHHLRFTLGPREMQAIDRFRRECQSLGLLPPPIH